MGVYRRKGSKYLWGKFQYKGETYRKSLETTRWNVAEKRLKDWKAEVKDQRWGGGPRLSFDEVTESFILNHIPNISENGGRRYMTSIRMLIPHFEGRYLDEVKGSVLADFEKARRVEGASSPTIRRDLACLSSIYTHAQVEMDYEGTIPVTAFLKKQSRRGRLKESAPRTRYLSHDEETRLLDAAKGDLRDLIAFAIDTGLRLEEQLSLTWPQVNIERREVTVKGKGGKTRTVPLLPRALSILDGLTRHLRPLGGPDWVFCKRDGTRYGKRTRGLAGALKRANEQIAKDNKNRKDKLPLMKHIKWHDLRRTCGCRLLQDHEFSLEQVKGWLGHSSINQTERAYAFLEVDQLHEAAGTKTGTGRAD